MKNILYLVVVILFSQCSSMYIPSMTNAPLLESKGETQLSLGASTNSVHLSGDYAFSDKYSVQVNGNISYHNFSNTYDIFTNENTNRNGELLTPDFDYGEFSHRYGEIGFGRYDILKSDWKLEAFIGSGYGVAYEKIGDIDSRYYLGFIQGNLGRKLGSGNSEFGFVCRLDYSDFNVSYFNSQLLDKSNVAFDNVGIEPAAFFRVGSNSLRFYTKVGLNVMYCFNSLNGINLSRGIKNGELNYTSVHFSLGVNYRFGQDEE